MLCAKCHILPVEEFPALCGWCGAAGGAYCGPCSKDNHHPGDLPACENWVAYFGV